MPKRTHAPPSSVDPRPLIEGQGEIVFVEDRNRITMPRSILLRAGWGEIRSVRKVIAELDVFGLVRLYDLDAKRTEIAQRLRDAQENEDAPDSVEIIEDTYRHLSLEKSRRMHLPPEVLFHLAVHPDEILTKAAARQGDRSVSDITHRRPAIYAECSDGVLSLLSLPFREERRARFLASQ